MLCLISTLYGSQRFHCVCQYKYIKWINPTTLNCTQIAVKWYSKNKKHTGTCIIKTQYVHMLAPDNKVCQACRLMQQICQTGTTLLWHDGCPCSCAADQFKVYDCKGHNEMQNSSPVTYMAVGCAQRPLLSSYCQRTRNWTLPVLFTLPCCYSCTVCVCVYTSSMLMMVWPKYHPAILLKDQLEVITT